MATEGREPSGEDVEVEASCTCPFCEREIPSECIEVVVHHIPKIKEETPNENKH